MLARIHGLLDLALAACDVAGMGLDLTDRPDVAYQGNPAARPRACVEVSDREGASLGNLVAYDLPSRADHAMPATAQGHLDAAAAALGDLLSVEALVALEVELISAVDLTRQAGRRREQREARVRQHVGTLLRGHVATLRSALDEAVRPPPEADADGSWRGTAHRVVALERAAAWAEELERLLDDVAVAREGLDEPTWEAHRLEDLVDGALDRMAQLGQRLGADDGRRVLIVRDVLLAVDGHAVQRALQHLLGAALISDPAENRAEHVEIDTHVEGDMCVVRIDDDGPPERVNDMRRRLVNGVGGTDADDSGLGICVVAAVASAHGGRCWIDASEMGGARVNLTLPVADLGELDNRRPLDSSDETFRPEPVRRHRHPSEWTEPTGARFSHGPSLEEEQSPASEVARERETASLPGASRPDNVRVLFEPR